MSVLGRFLLGRKQDLAAFKIPDLRNVLLTALCFQRWLAGKGTLKSTKLLLARCRNTGAGIRPQSGPAEGVPRLPLDEEIQPIGRELETTRFTCCVRHSKYT